MDATWKIKCYKTLKDGAVTIEQCEYACVIKYSIYPELVGDEIQFVLEITVICSDSQTRRAITAKIWTRTHPAMPTSAPTRS